MPRRSWLMLYWLLLSACVSIGNADLASEQTMTNIQVGQTSREEVRNLLGEPDSQLITELRGSTREWWSYSYLSAVINPIDYILLYGLWFSGIGQYDTRHDVQVFFDHRGVVSSLSKSKTDYDMGNPITPLDVSSVSTKIVGFSQPTNQSVQYEDRMEVR